MTDSGLDPAGNVTDPVEWLELNPAAPKWLRDIVETLIPDDHVRVTKTRDGQGWRRVIAGRKRKHQARLVLDDRGGEICLLDNWITPEKVPNLIAALRAAVDEIEQERQKVLEKV